MIAGPSFPVLRDAMEHAEACSPLEACGVILEGSFVPLNNLATEPDIFIMDMKAFCRIEKERKVSAIVHSHVNLPPIAGEADRAMCEKSGLPWLIVSWPFGTWCWIVPEGREAPLVGREWAWGSNDCFGLVRDGFRAYTGITIPDYPRDWNFWKRGGNDIGNAVAASDFVPLPVGTVPLHCDLIGMAVKAPVVNHLALFLAPDQILHQFHGRLSVREVYDGLLQSLTKLHLRHKRFLA